MKKKTNLINSENLELKLSNWIKNQELELSDEFYIFLRDNLDSLDAVVSTRLKSTFNLNNEKLSKEIKIVILQIIAKNKENYSYIKSFWEKDISKNYIYFRFMIQSNTEKAIEDFKNYILDKKLKVDIFKDDIEFDKNDLLEKNQIKYLLTSLGYIYKNKKQFNLVGKLNYLRNDDIEFIIKTYYKCFNSYVIPQKEHRLDEYAVMDWIIGRLIESLDFDKIELLKKILNTDNDDLKNRVKNRIVNILEIQEKNGCYLNDYYKDLIDSYKEVVEEEFFDYDVLAENLTLCSEKLLKISNKEDFEKEIPLNIKMRTLLETKGYNIAGEDEIYDGKSKRDIIVKNEFQSEKTIIEAIRVLDNSKQKIKEHYEKLIDRYNFLGHKVNYLLIYSNYNNFPKLYKNHIEIYSKSNRYEELASDKSAIKLGKSYYIRSDDSEGIVFHIFVDFNSIKE